MASLIGLFTRARHYRRIYGTFLFPEVLNRKKIWLSNLFEYLSFKLPVNGLVVTNDGTSGDKVFNYLSKNSAKLHFLLNGIDKEAVGVEHIKNLDMEGEFFTYVARIDEWKRQHLLIKALAELQKSQVDFPHTYLVGPIYSNGYKVLLEELIKNNNLSEKITILGALSKDEANWLIKKSMLTFSLYDYSNLGNVFLEALSMGTPILALNVYGSLDYFPEDIYFPIEKPEPIMIKKKIIEVMSAPERIKVVGKKSKDFAQQNILSWDERVLLEKKVIFNN